MNQFGNVRSILPTFGTTPLRAGSREENTFPFDHLVPAMYKRALISSQWYSYDVLQQAFQGISDRTGTHAAAENVIVAIERGVMAEFAVINEQIRVYQLKNEFPKNLYQIGIACVKMRDSLRACISALCEGTQGDLDATLAEFRAAVIEHESVREAIVFENELKGRQLLERYAGPFSSMVPILGWGIVMYVTGLHQEKSFRSLLSKIEEEFEALVASFGPPFCLSASWIGACAEVRGALALVRSAFFPPASVGLNNNVDPLILRGTLGSLAQSLSKLNAAIKEYAHESESGRRMFSASLKHFVGKSHRMVLTLDSAFYPTVTQLTSN